MTKLPHSRKIEEYGLSADSDERLISFLIKVIHQSARLLAILMTFVIVWGILDVLWILITKLREPPYFLLNINDILATFGAFLAVLIAIEIFANITMYLRDDIIHVRLVLATALMAIARKVIIFDYSKHTAGQILATAAVILALGVTFWLLTRRNGVDLKSEPEDQSSGTDSGSTCPGRRSG